MKGPAESTCKRLHGWLDHSHEWSIAAGGYGRMAWHAWHCLNTG